MNENRKNFIVGIICSAVIFGTGVLYLIIPAYYGLNQMADINTNSLFLSLMLISSSVYFFKSVLLGSKPRHESLYLCLASCVSGLANVLLSSVFENSLLLSISLLTYVLIVSAIKLFTVDYYHDREDAYYYIESMLLVMFFIVGIVTACNLFNDTLLQTIMLGFFFIICGILEAVNVSIKCMLKAKRFLKKIKLK